MRSPFPRIYVKVTEIRINPFPSLNVLPLVENIYEKRAMKKKNSFKQVSLVLIKKFSLVHRGTQISP